MQHQSVKKNFLGYTPVKVTNVELISQSLISSGTNCWNSIGTSEAATHLLLFFFFSTEKSTLIWQKKGDQWFFENFTDQ